MCRILSCAFFWYINFLSHNLFNRILQKNWKLLDLLNTTADYLKQKNIENARLNAELMLAAILNIDRIRLYVEFERPITDDELTRYRSLIARRSRREPLQYILGQTEFMGLPFDVNPAVLIPRPETEILCEEILKLKDNNTSLTSLLDIGTGSGCIAISIAHYWPVLTATAIDFSGEALDTAKKNAQLNKVQNITFLKNDILTDRQDQQIETHYSIIVSNPPYIAQTEMNDLQSEVKDFEPRAALTDEADGLKFYKRIFELLSSKQLTCDYCFLEISGSFPEKIKAQAREFNFTDYQVIKDLNGIDRVLKIRF